MKKIKLRANFPQRPYPKQKGEMLSQGEGEKNAEMWEAIMEMTEFGMDQGHIQRDNKCLSKARRLANVAYETLCNQIFWDRKSPHGDKHPKKKGFKPASD